MRAPKTPSEIRLDAYQRELARLEADAHFRFFEGLAVGCSGTVIGAALLWLAFF